MALFGVGYVLLPYLWQRATRLLASHDDPFSNADDGFGGADGGGDRGGGGGGWLTRRRAAAAWKMLRWLEGAYKVGVVANMVVFLQRGVYRCALTFTRPDSRGQKATAALFPFGCAAHHRQCAAPG